ncbi:Hypothetical protein PBC10988_3780 [Planctomycetales bacterium 10988]|nr:Hypothetical protein PBC10988_3780 [Planctomycetales bacterium 10988]
MHTSFPIYLEKPIPMTTETQAEPQTSTTATPFPGGKLWAVLFLLWLVGIACNSVLAWQYYQLTLSDTPLDLPGCGATEALDCNSVIGSPYGRLAGFSLTTFAFGYYAIQFVLLIWARREGRSRVGLFPVLGLPAFASTAVIMGGWAAATMHFRLESYCIWCLAVHATNLLFFLFAAAFARAVYQYQRAESVTASQKVVGRGPIFATVLAIILMASWQTFLLANYHGEPQMADEELPQDLMQILVLEADAKDTSEEEASETENSSEVIWTNLGSREASNKIVFFACYTCPHCKAVFNVLEEILKEHPDDLRVDLRMNPLWSDCNPYISPEVQEERHQYACQAALVGIAIAEAAPEKFEEYSEWAFRHQTHLTPYLLEQKGRELLGEATFDELYQSDEIKDRLAKDMQLSGRVKVAIVPQLYLGKRRLSGAITRVKLLEILDEEFNWGESKPEVPATAEQAAS